MGLLSRLSLSSRLTLLAVITLCPLAILVVLSHLEDRETRRDEGVREATTQAQTYANSLESYARDLDGFLAAAALVIGSDATPSTPEAIGAYLKSLTTRYPTIAAIFTTDAQGRVTASSNSPTGAGTDLSQRPYIQTLMNGAERTWSGALTGIQTGQLTAAFGRAITDVDGNRLGYIVAAFYPSTVSQEPEGFPSDGNFFMFDQNGKPVLSLRDPELTHVNPDLAGFTAVQTALHGELAVFKNETTPFDSGKRYGAIVPIPSMGWSIGFSRSQSVLEGSLQDRLLRDLGVIGLIMAVTIAVLVVAARQISRPLQALSEVADEIAAGRRTELPRLGGDRDVLRLRDAFASMSTAVAEREDQLREQARTLATMEEVGAWLASDLDFQKTVQAITDAGTRLTEAQFGAFFYNSVREDGESYQLYTLSGVDPTAFADFPMPRNTPIFAPTFNGEAVVRIDDVQTDTRYGELPPHFGQPKGHLPVHSYLAVPVFSTRGDVMGGIFFGHERVGVFTEKHERLATGIASWGSIALDNARLYAEAQGVQEDLRHSNRAKDEFLGLVSHELRTPTSTIFGGLRLLQRHRDLDEESSNELITSMAEEAERLVRLIENLLAFARTELGRIVEPQPTNINNAATSTMSAFARLHPSRPLTFEPKEGLPLAMAETTYFDQVLQNLLSNADKYSPHGQPIDVETSFADGFIRVSVRDHGEGVPEGEISNIFESFYRSERTASAASGQGLGLTVCKRLVEAQGGRIGARNHPEGGLIVTFTLPEAASEPAQEPEPVTAPSS